MSRFVRSLSIVLPALTILIIFGCAASDPATPADTLQGWDSNARGSWYTASQGSRLIPRVWLDNLEQPGADNTGMFLNPTYIRTFR
ncbi:MAG TPA: hypothetical protein VGM42_16755, partial [Rhodopila sp.]